MVIKLGTGLDKFYKSMLKFNRTRGAKKLKGVENRNGFFFD